MATQTPKRILIAPLDWGLGHTTRCVPIIRYLLSQGHIPVVACNQSQRSFIEEIFDDIDIIHLNGYNVIYSKWNKFGQIGLLSQLPGINKTIAAEHKWLQQHAEALQPDGIISDNRYGFYHTHIPSVIMTHQLQVQTGFGNISDRAVQKLHYRYLNRFNATWVVDTPGIPNLAGKLSHPSHLPDNTEYLGLLSQFEDIHTPHTNIATDTLLVLISGPEPQRTALSKILWKQAQEHNGKVTFVEGSENALSPVSIPPHISYHKRLAGKALAVLLQSAGMVICRSGYSTLMDLAVLNKKVILIPTPGQTEQEYLGKHLYEKGIFYCTKQDGFELSNALKCVSKFPYKPTNLHNAYSGYGKVMDEWISGL